jgi:Arc/MetJ-type ribon-helix-helix transcriptional regulator
MNILLTPEQEALVKRELESGHFRSVEELLSKALDALREKEVSARNSVANGEQQQAVNEMLAFLEKNHTRLDGISVKDLIHALQSPSLPIQ